VDHGLEAGLEIAAHLVLDRADDVIFGHLGILLETWRCEGEREGGGKRLIRVMLRAYTFQINSIDFSFDLLMCYKFLPQFREATSDQDLFINKRRGKHGMIV